MRNYTLLTLACTLLMACGVKPDHVDPPEGKGSSNFPQTYPDLTTDPGSTQIRVR